MTVFQWYVIKRFMILILEVILDNYLQKLSNSFDFAVRCRALKQLLEDSSIETNNPKT